MKCDIILSGVGGQGTLSVAAIIAKAAVAEGFSARQSEVHGMAQRGGAVLSHLRIAGTPFGENSLSRRPIASDLIPRGGADLIISMEPLESLRHAEWLSPNGTVVSAAEPFDNIPNYPEISGIIKLIESFPSSRIVNASALAKEAGLAKAVNMVMVGAASAFLPVKPETLVETIEITFAKKEPSVAKANIKAFELGRSAAK